MRAIGIDIGTTTVSLVMVDGRSGEVLGSRTIPHRSFIKGRISASRIQDPEKIRQVVMEGLSSLQTDLGRPDSIGLTGQMHGMLYIDRQGNAVSPLYTWQDLSGNELLSEGRTCAEILKELTGSAASGYGLTTHYYLMRKRALPDEAAGMVTISDYIGMKLCGRRDPYIARDMAASWGCYDLEIGDFCRDELEELDMDLSMLPRILPGHEIIGSTQGGFRRGIPVSASLGDNQASVLGSVRSLADTVLLNIGTGSQISFTSDRYVDAEGSIELRPCTEGLYLMAGSSLCGGRAYAMLEEFYRNVAGRQDEKDLYAAMEQQARAFMETSGREAAWKIRTTFAGTRSHPRERGMITGIGVENFHPGALTLGMLQGILEELLDMYREMCRLTGKRAEFLVGAGNGIRRNRLLRLLAGELFRMPLMVPVCREEAAYGAALQSLVSAGFVSGIGELQQKIRYEEE